MPALIVDRDADRLLAAAVALQRIAEQVPADTRIMRGSFYAYSLDGPELEVHFETVPGARQTAERLRCGLKYECGDWEPSPRAGEMLRRHLWVGHVGAIPTILAALEAEPVMPEPEPVEGARFPAATPSPAEIPAEQPGPPEE